MGKWDDIPIPDRRELLSRGPERNREDFRDGLVAMMQLCETRADADWFVDHRIMPFLLAWIHGECHGSRELT